MLLRSFSAAPWIVKTDGELKSLTVIVKDTRNKQVVHNGLLLQAGLLSAGLDVVRSAATDQMSWRSFERSAVKVWWSRDCTVS